MSMDQISIMKIYLKNMKAESNNIGVRILKINYSLAGLGGISRIHLMGLRNIPILNLKTEAKINLAGLLTTHKKENYEYAQLIGFDNIVETIEELVKIPGIDIVDICTPNYLHKEQVLEAIKAEKHVYCEKPLALNIHEGKEILEALQNTDVQNQMGYVLRFLPAIGRARAIIKNNILGKVYSVRGEIYHSSYLNPEKGMTWRLNKEKSGGGALVDLGSHMIDLIHFLLGEIDIVQSWTDTIVKERPTANGEMQKVDVDDWALLMIKLKAGIKGTIEASRIAVGNEGIRIKIYCEKSSISISPDAPYYPKLFDEKSREMPFDDKFIGRDEYVHELLKVYPTPKLSQGWMIDTHTASLAWFIKKIETNKKSPFDPDFKEGCKTQNVIENAYNSAKEGGIPIKLNY